ncbi:hypothetical protein ACLMJK_007675 [Lecanora helva]
MDNLQRTHTRFPGNAVGSPAKRLAETDLAGPAKRGGDIPASRLSASTIPSPPKFVERQQRIRPPATLPIKANLRSQQFSPTPRFGPKEKGTSNQQDFVQRCDPWQESGYRRILKDEHSQMVVAHKQEISHPIVIAKEHQLTGQQKTANIVRCNHENIVHIIEAYVNESIVTFIYERMDVSLSEIQATPYGQLAAYQIAAICQKVRIRHKSLSSINEA